LTLQYFGHGVMGLIYDPNQPSSSGILSSITRGRETNNYNVI
jgi:hypothetical protein